MGGLHFRHCHRIGATHSYQGPKSERQTPICGPLRIFSSDATKRTSHCTYLVWLHGPLDLLGLILWSLSMRRHRHHSHSGRRAEERCAWDCGGNLSKDESVSRAHSAAREDPTHSRCNSKNKNKKNQQAGRQCDRCKRHKAAKKTRAKRRRHSSSVTGRTR